MDDPEEFAHLWKAKWNEFMVTDKIDSKELARVKEAWSRTKMSGTSEDWEDNRTFVRLSVEENGFDDWKTLSEFSIFPCVQMRFVPISFVVDARTLGPERNQQIYWKHALETANWIFEKWKRLRDPTNPKISFVCKHARNRSLTMAMYFAGATYLSVGGADSGRAVKADILYGDGSSVRRIYDPNSFGGRVLWIDFMIDVIYLARDGSKPFLFPSKAFKGMNDEIYAERGVGMDDWTPGGVENKFVLRLISDAIEEGSSDYDIEALRSAGNRIGSTTTRSKHPPLRFGFAKGESRFV